MKKHLLLCACFLPMFASSQTPDWQQETDYSITVSLNEVEHTLDGFEKIIYINRSPDTLRFVWFHLWPNAYKNDRTAFSEQTLRNGRTDFYFSDRQDRGFINRLDFRVNGREAKTIDHPFYIDVVRVDLPAPLPPGQQVLITTPFHEKLPFDFSNYGHAGNSCLLTHWYPQPAVYDRKGWHEMPYLDQQGSYSEVGSFDVRIALPASYSVAATGALQGNAAQALAVPRAATVLPKKQNQAGTHPPSVGAVPRLKVLPMPDTVTKTLEFKQDRISDFVWLADQRLVMDADTLQTPSGGLIHIYSCYLPEDRPLWKQSIGYIKDALRFRNALMGPYPYQTVTVVETTKPFEGDAIGYPTIAFLPSVESNRELDLAIERTVGQNWLCGALASNERSYPWMSEGMNTYYDDRYEAWKYADKGQGARATDSWLKNKMPYSRTELSLDVIMTEKTDQPIATAGYAFNQINKGLVPTNKAARWMKLLEQELGTPLFDSCMRAYYDQWRFRHPYPEDFKATVEDISGRRLDSTFSLLDKKGPLRNAEPSLSKQIKPAFLFSQRNTQAVDYVGLAPAVGYNLYDKWMLGAIIHNIDLPPNPFQFILVPLYATGSKQFNGIGDIGYMWYPDSRFQKIEVSLSAARFSTLSGTDSNGRNIFGGFYKFVPAIRLTLQKNSPLSSMEKWVDFRTYFIGEKAFNYVIKSTDSNYYPTAQPYALRYLNQLTFNAEDYRVLYPYDVQLQFQQASNFYRVNFTTHYFFNYSKGGGMSVRVFAAKFGMIGGNSPDQELATYYFQPKLTASIGTDDYTYSNYFIGRNEYEGISSQQIMMRDGGLKIRTDEFQDLQGRSENWIAAMNFNTTLPRQFMPPQIPLKIFLDIGTYAEAWGSNPPTSKFLYVAGLQLSLIKNILYIYAPLVYSSDFSSQLKSLGSQNTFGSRISFSIDVQNIDFKKIFRNTPF